MCQNLSLLLKVKMTKWLFLYTKDFPPSWFFVILIPEICFVKEQEALELEARKGKNALYPLLAGSIW